VESDAVELVMGRHRPWVYTLALLLALISEGYDLQAANFAAPAIVRALGISKAQVGPLLSASLLGVLFGAALIGPLGDRWGRKRLIIGGRLGYGVLSLAAAGAMTLPQLILLRFLFGLGLGGVLPNALALASELARPGGEATAAGLIGIGITFGGVVAGLTSAALLPRYGWPSMFLVGGLLPLMIVVLLQLLLPKSPAYATREQPAVRSWTLPGPASLFRHGSAGKTLAIWLIFIAASLLLARRGWNVVTLFAAMACLTLAMLVLGLRSTPLLALGVIVAGFCVTGTQNAINGAGGASYAAGIRSSGLGWALGVGRLGSVAGPLVGSLAVLLGMKEARHLFALPLLPLVVAGLAALWLGRRVSI